MSQSTSPAFRSPPRDRQDLIKLRWHAYQQGWANAFPATDNQEQPIHDRCDPESCDHEWAIVNDSFTHEHGTHIDVYEMCDKCDAIRDHEPFYYGDEYL